jgi:hypothetical protein
MRDGFVPTALVMISRERPLLSRVYYVKIYNQSGPSRSLQKLVRLSQAEITVKTLHFVLPLCPLCLRTLDSSFSHRLPNAP